jgi:NTE family protein
MTRSFVLSGGGNRGPLEVGAARVLLERGIVPELVVGSSAGALNGAFLAADPTVAQMDRMAEVWREAGRRKVIANSAFNTILKLLRGKPHLMDNAGLARFITSSLPPGVREFGDLKLPFYCTIAHWATRALYVYGDDPRGPLAEALVTSAAVPGYFPPTWAGGEAFVDGGVVSNVPVEVAVARGATELWVIDLAYSTDVPRKLDNSLTSIRHAIFPALYKEALAEMASVCLRPGVTLHHIPVYDYQDVGLGDFGATGRMFELGAEAARRYLDRPAPNVVRYPRVFAEAELPAGPVGSRPFVSG